MEQENFLYENGVKAKSVVTGFSGIITARANHLHGCNRYWLQPPVDKDGKILDGYWFDEGELEMIPCEKIEPKNNYRGGFHSKIK